MLIAMELWMTKSAFLLCSIDIAGAFQILYQGNHDHLEIHVLLIFFILASLTFSIISKWPDEDHIWAARICGHVGMLIALLAATLLLSFPFNGRFKWLPLVACAVPLFLLFSELHQLFCSTKSPNTPSRNGEPISVANNMKTGLVSLNLDSPISENSQLSSSSTNHVELSLCPVETNLVEPQSANFKWVSWIFHVFCSISVLYLLSHLPLRGCRAVVEDSSNHVSPNTNQLSPELLI